jgi:hypothetical protein
MTEDFDQWLRWAFDHPAAHGVEKPWYFAPGAQQWDAERDPRLTLAFVTRLFSEPEVLIGRFTPDQIGQGLWLLADPSCSSHLLALVDPSIEWAARKEAIESIAILYERLFQKVCARQLSHLAASSQSTNLANRICYMFWEVCPLGPRGDAAREPDLACLDVMRRTLAIPHCACQEGALHGLAHWSASYPAIVKNAIAHFLAEPDPLAPRELLLYAKRQ